MQADQTPAVIVHAADDPGGQGTVGRLLRVGGHAVGKAGTGQEALRLARAQPPDLMVVGAGLPDMSALEVVRALKADPATVQIPVLHLVAAVDPESVGRGLEAGADACLAEPVEEAALRATVRTLIRMGRAQRAAAEARMEAEVHLQQLEAVFEATSFPIIVYDGAGTPVRANPAAAAAWGFDPAATGRVEAAQRRAMRYPDGAPVPPEALPSTRALKGEVVEGERYLFANAHGEEHVAIHAASPLRSGDQVQGAVAVWYDITEQHRAARERAQAYQLLEGLNKERERLLAEVERQRSWLDTVLENTEAHLVVLDRDFNFLHVNAAYARACRKAPEEFAGHNHFEFYPHPENEAIFRRVRDTGEPFAIREKPFEYPDMPERGVTYWDWTLVPIKGETGEVEHLVFSLLDVTEQVRMRQRLVEAERGRTEIAERMTAEINHRMKNNLMLLTSVMQMQLASLPAGSISADAIQDAMARIASLSVVHEHLYRGQSGKVELRDVLRRVGDVATHALTARRVALAVSGPECYVSSKLGSTLAILANELITNAMKYGAPAGDGLLRIAVSLSREGGRLRLRVWNSGNPIGAGFDPEQQAGMGLGLVQGVVTSQLRGSFAIHAQGDGTLAEMSFAESVLDASHVEAEG